VASTPDGFLKAKKLGGISDRRSEIQKISNNLLIKYVLDPTNSPFGNQLLEMEHLFRLHNPKYAKKFQRIQTEFAKNFALEKNRYDIFNVDAFSSVPIPKDNAFSSWLHRMQGMQCVQIIDINGDHKPDDGDTCITRNGNLYPNAHFTGDSLVAFYTGKTCNPSQEFKNCGTLYSNINTFMQHLNKEHTGTTFNVHHPKGIEQTFMSLANESSGYTSIIKNQTIDMVKSMGLSIKKNPIITGATFVITGGLLLYPSTQGIVLSLMQWTMGATAAGGTAYLVYDRAKGLIEFAKDLDLKKYKKNTGNYDVVAFISMLSGASVLKNVTVVEAIRKVFYTPTVAFNAAASIGRKLFIIMDATTARFFGNIGGPPAVLAAIGGGCICRSVALDMAPIAIAALGGTPNSSLPIKMFALASIAEHATNELESKYILKLPSRTSNKQKYYHIKIQGGLKTANAKADEKFLEALSDIEDALKKLLDENPKNHVATELDKKLKFLRNFCRQTTSDKSDEILITLQEIVDNIENPYYEWPAQGNGLELALKEANATLGESIKGIKTKYPTLLDIKKLKEQTIEGTTYLLDKDRIIEHIPKHIILTKKAREEATKTKYQGYLNRAIAYFSKTDSLKSKSITSGISFEELPMIHEYGFNRGGSGGGAIRVVFHRMTGNPSRITILSVFNNKKRQSILLEKAAKLAEKLGLPSIGIGYFTFKKE